ncbi:MAG TPA: hypothetical protein VHI71_03140 [Actinomycetota bacterium]|nr:hypothetical protein [Actinomycetota bacterium]
MPFYEVTDGGLRVREPADFGALGFTERGDLQRLLREDISPLGDDLLVIAEEFGEWEDARRRIDLLAIDRSGRLVVIELKRTETGGRMDLQAVRYAAMVSAMELGDVARTYARHLGGRGYDAEVDAMVRLMEFLEPEDESDELTISPDVRIILVGRDFGREITTTVLWLNRFEGMDVRCVRVVPYEVERRLLLDVEQVLPLPEAADYQVQIRRKEAARERSRSTRDYTRFHIVVDGHELPAQNKRNAVRSMVEQLVGRGVSVAAIQSTIPKRMSVLAGVFRTGDEVRAVLSAENVDPERWFTDSPFVDEITGCTYVLSNQWGVKTEQRLEDLSAAFPEAKVSFRRADPDGG